MTTDEISLSVTGENHKFISKDLNLMMGQN